MQTKVDVECNVAGGGPSGQAGALRWGIAMSLRSFVDGDMLEQMRLGECYIPVISLINYIRIIIHKMWLEAICEIIMIILGTKKI